VRSQSFIGEARARGSTTGDSIFLDIFYRQVVLPDAAVLFANFLGLENISRGKTDWRRVNQPYW
jgi:hypothetical protein